MFSYNYNLTLYFFLISCIMFSFLFKHILLTLISLEFMMLNSMMMFYMTLLKTNFNMYLMSILLTIMICESILGLSILIFTIRISGNDYLKTLNLMKW